MSLLSWFPGCGLGLFSHSTPLRPHCALLGLVVGVVECTGVCVCGVWRVARRAFSGVALQRVAWVWAKRGPVVGVGRSCSDGACVWRCAAAARQITPSRVCYASRGAVGVSHAVVVRGKLLWVRQ